MSGQQPWDFQPYLDELRPGHLERVNLALFATYSVDLSAVAATLLALIGRNSDAGSGTAVDFAEAIDQLRGRVKVIIQRGRIARPLALPRIAGILDQFIVEQPYDERLRSWHPKIALVAYDTPSKDVRWKLWIGSRNLTRSEDLDVGVLLDGTAKKTKGAVRLSGVGTLGATLARASARPDAAALARTLDEVWWQAPKGLRLRLLLDGLEEDAALPMQPPASRIDGLTLVSPFLSPGFLKVAGTWGPDGKRTLISTLPALVKLAQDHGHALAGFTEILAYEAPDAQPDAAPAAPASGSDDDAERRPPALHAKLVCFHTKARTILRVGSANATSRAWEGHNAEVMLELEAGAAFREGLGFLCGKARPVTREDLAKTPRTPLREADALEETRKALMAIWTPVLRHENGCFRIDAGAVPVLPHKGHQLFAGAANGDLLAWPPDAGHLDLGRIPLSQQSAFIQVRLEGETDSLRWMQKVAVDPPLDAQRDIAALASQMGLHMFHTWMRAMLSGDTPPGDGADWDDDTPGTRPGRQHQGADRLTLEDILVAWARDRQAFHRANQHFSRYVTALHAHDTTLSAAEKAELAALESLWHIIQSRLPS